MDFNNNMEHIIIAIMSLVRDKYKANYFNTRESNMLY